MKYLIILLLLALPAFAINRVGLLGAIKLVENTPVLGANGEHGPYQFTRATWRQHSKQPFSVAKGTSGKERAEQARVALAHVHWIEANIADPTVYRMALAWNAGVTAVNTNRLQQRHWDYAQRVVNVYGEITK